ncbi:MAG: M13 family metallopeptidase N-terminal domain-containing protein [Bacteroidales bacterium]|nr:M13 family metallopeptidase N-terminal domain-containing protein [Bacteroidales bacterium]
MKMKMLMGAVSTALLLSSFTVLPTDEGPEKNGGIKKENRDESVRPGDDFYQYATGGWRKANPLPAEYGRYGSFEVLEQKTNQQLRDLIEELSKTQHPQGSVAQKVADVYRLAMDTETRTKQGATPLKNDLKAIASIKTVDQLFNHIAQMMITGSSPFFGCRIGTYREDSNPQIRK